MSVLQKAVPQEVCPCDARHLSQLFLAADQYLDNAHEYLDNAHLCPAEVNAIRLPLQSLLPYGCTCMDNNVYTPAEACKHLVTVDTAVGKLEAPGGT